MEFSLAFSPQMSALPPAEQKRCVLATNAAALEGFGLRLTPDEAEMLCRTEQDALAAEQLVRFGEGITPRLIHWFLPSGCLTPYAATVARLTEVFYHIRGRLQAICDAVGDTECMLSDNAILDYMYQLFVSPNCGGDPDLLQVLTERIVVTGMQRLLDLRAQKPRHVSDADPVTRALYADMLRQYDDEPDADAEFARDLFDYTYREEMHRDVFGNFYSDYIDPAGDNDVVLRSRGTFAEDLQEKLARCPELLLPSPEQEAEWDNLTADWEEQDAAAARLL